MQILQTTARVIFVICIPLLLITSNIRFMISETYLYEYGFHKYNVSEVTGITDSELIRAAKGLIHYFNSSEDSAQIQVIKEGKEMDLFTQREITHLADVKQIVRLLYLVQWITFGYVGIYVLAGLALLRRSFLTRLSKNLIYSGILTIAVFIVLGLWAAIDFDNFFRTFHEVSFSNDLWKLDPSHDYLIMMFPEGFWADAAFFLVGGAVIEVLILGGVSWSYLRYLGKGNATV